MSTTETDLSMLSIETALAPQISLPSMSETRGPRDGFGRADRGDRGRVLDVNNFDAIRISLASPEAIRSYHLSGISRRRRVDRLLITMRVHANISLALLRGALWSGSRVERDGLGTVRSLSA